MIEDSQKIRAELLLYLADELSPENRERFDQSLLDDDDFARSIDDAEEDLIEDYAAGTLAADELPVVKRWVEGSAQRRRRAALIAALRADKTGAAKVPRSGKRWVWLLPVAAALALLAVLPLVHRGRPKAPALPVSEPVLQAKVEALPVPSTGPTPGPIDTILLDTHRFRGSGDTQAKEHRFLLHAGSTARIQILLPSGAAGPFTVDLRSEPAGDQPAIHVTGLKPIAVASQAYVELSLPPNAMHPGSYTGDLRSASASYPLHFLVIDK